MNNIHDGATPLTLAIYDGHTRGVQVLLEASADIDKPTTEGDTPLETALKERQEEVVKILIASGACPLAHLPGTLAPIHVAVQNFDAKIVEELLKAGADCNTIYQDGSNALSIAVLYRKITTAKLLLAVGADPNTLVKPHPNGILVRSSSPITGLRESRVEQFTDPFCANGYYSYTTLALSMGCVEMTRLMIDGGADVNFGVHGQFRIRGAVSPLQVAAKLGCHETVTMLLAASVDVDAVSCGDSPLLCAVKGGFSRCVQILVDAGANISSPSDPCMHTPLGFAVKSGFDEIVSILLNAGAHVSGSDNFGLGISHYAARQGNPEVLRMLTLAGAEVHSSTPTNGTPLQAAIKTRNRSCILPLLDAGADIDIAVHGLPPIQMAAVVGDLCTVELLAANGASLAGLTMRGALSKSVEPAVKRGLLKLAALPASPRLWRRATHHLLTPGRRECIETLLLVEIRVRGTFLGLPPEMWMAILHQIRRSDLSPNPLLFSQ
eukprot:m.312883 g.312883  ORF g.312883 m.312883 type:complete len:494 (+) comp16405_c0_seq19:794-2275(+)